MTTRTIPVLLFMLLVSGCAGRVEGETRQLTLDDYRRFFDRVHADNVSLLTRQAASGEGHTYYTFSYALEGTLAMYEGTGDAKYLEQVLHWAETMVAQARIVDSQGKRNWEGTGTSPYTSARIALQLDEFQGSTALARVARLILTTPPLKQRYSTRAQAIYTFVTTHVVDKQLARSEATVHWFSRNAADASQQYSDKTAILVRLLLDLYQIDGNRTYLALAEQLLHGFKSRLTPSRGGSMVWDQTAADGTPDTSHANRHAYMAVDAYEARVIITRENIVGLARLVTEVIWDQSLMNPRFSNFVDGSNVPYRKRGAWNNGQIASGWMTLGAHDHRAQSVGRATLEALTKGVRNPSLDYMRSTYGLLNLIGILARNERTHD